MSCLHFISSARTCSPGLVLIDTNRWSSHHFSLLHVPSGGSYLVLNGVHAANSDKSIPPSGLQYHFQIEARLLQDCTKTTPFWGVTRRGVLLTPVIRGNHSTALSLPPCLLLNALTPPPPQTDSHSGKHILALGTNRNSIGLSQACGLDIAPPNFAPVLFATPRQDPD